MGSTIGFSLAALTVCVSCLAGSAVAATPLGQTFNPTGLGNCGPNQTEFQTTSSSSTYAAPAPGVITGWSFQGGTGGDAPGLMKLKVARAAPGAGNFEVVGESALVDTTAGVLNSFATRIPVAAGDVIGLHYAEYAGCGQGGASGYATHGGVGDPPVGSIVSLTPTPNFKLDVAATLEPDADDDGFGDETQDCNPASASLTTDCDPPHTAITQRPKDKTRKKKATFAFSSEAGSTFQCSVDGAPFSACTSPDTLKVSKGKHHFEVRAIDAAGNVDGSPATDDWKVKKKRKRK